MAAAREELSHEQARRQDVESRLTATSHLAPAVPSHTDDGMSALTLKPGLISSGKELSKVDLPSASKGLNLTLTLPGGAAAYPMYAAALLSAEGKPIWTAAHLARSGKSVPFVIPAGRLKRADYQVLLRGVLNNGHPEDLAGYAFRVAAR